MYGIIDNFLLLQDLTDWLLESLRNLSALHVIPNLKWVNAILIGLYNEMQTNCSS